MADLKKMSEEQLDEAAFKLQASKDEIREKLLAIHEERSARAAEARAAQAEGGVVIEGATAVANGGGN